MKKFSVLFAMVSLAIVSSAVAGGGRPDEGGGHVGIDVGASYLPFYQASFGYNVAAGKAWVVVELGQDESVDGATVWNSQQREFPVDGLTMNTATNEIELFGIPCAKAQPNKVLSGEDYPQKTKGYSGCSITPTTTVETNFKGETLQHTVLSLDSSA
jgi:hypothetical protein